MTDKEYVRIILKGMLSYYSDNIGEKSKYTGDIITHKMIAGVTRRYLGLGGKLVFGADDTDIEV